MNTPFRESQRLRGLPPLLDEPPGPNQHGQGPSGPYPENQQPGPNQSENVPSGPNSRRNGPSGPHPGNVPSGPNPRSNGPPGPEPENVLPETNPLENRPSGPNSARFGPSGPNHENTFLGPDAPHNPFIDEANQHFRQRDFISSRLPTGFRFFEDWPPLPPPGEGSRQHREPPGFPPMNVPSGPGRKEQWPFRPVSRQQGPPGPRDDDAYSVVSFASTNHSSTSEYRRKKRDLELQRQQQILAMEEEEEALVLAKNKMERRKALLKLQYDKELEEIEDDRLSTEEVFGKTPEPLQNNQRQPAPSNRDEDNASAMSLPAGSEARSEALQMGQMIAAAIKDGMEKVNLKSSSGPTEQMLARQSYRKDLQPFIGKPEQWLTFISSFRRSTEICGFSDDENLLRLQKCLKGEARAAVESMLDAPKNVSAIMRRLEVRFGQKCHIVRSLIINIQGVAAVKENDLNTLIQFGQKVLNLVETLKSMDSECYLANPQLLHDLVEKLPPQMKMKWLKRTQNQETRTLAYFSDWLNEKVELACQLVPPKINEMKTEKEKKRGVHLTQDGKKEKKGKFCQFCKKDNHRIQQCSEFKQCNVNDRYKCVKARKLCFGCLNFGHSFKNEDKQKECRSKKKCTEEGCESFHHPLLHNPNRQPATEHQPEIPSAPALHHILHIANRVSYQVVPVILRASNEEIKTHALLDLGSAYTLLDQEVASQLKLKGMKDDLFYTTVGSNKQGVHSENVTITIVNPQDQKQFLMHHVNTFPSLGLYGGTVTQAHLDRWKHLRGLPLPNYTNVEPKILIGLPHARLITPTRVVPGRGNAPIAAQTPLGWTVFGQLPIPEEAERIQNVSSINSIETIEGDSLHQLVKSYFTTEEFGVKVTSRNPYTKQEERADLLARKTLRNIGGKYEIGLLWAEDHVSLPESRTNAERRLKSLERKMDSDPTFAQKYCENVQHYLNSGYLIKMSKEEVENVTPNTWYLPHFAVKKASKPDKLRLVFDAAAKSHGVSLNDKLLSGPDILNPLPSVLCKFRERKIGFTADIREMFHQVSMRAEDQQSQRILWRGMDRAKPPEVYRMAVMTFGATCSPFCAQLTKNENALQYQDQQSLAVDSILNKEYVDDHLDSCDSTDEAFQQFEAISNIQKAGGFELRNWISNDAEFIQRIPEELKSNSQKSLGGTHTMSREQVLGLNWLPSEDVFTFTTNFQKVSADVAQGKKIPTKREALSLIMSIFDPMGFIAPLTVKAKIILQKTWQTGITWDDQLPDSLHKRWKAWINELITIVNFKIPRCYSHNFSKANEVELHIFCDASELAFACVAYFRIETGETAFVAAKTRVTPMKAMTIPRYELQAAVMGTRLAQSISQWHSITPTQQFFWTDSKTVKCWVNMESCTLKPFVSNRVSEIQESTQSTDWRWISTQDNVADEATRDKEPCDLSQSSRWLNGPPFLRLPHEEWPTDPHDHIKAEEIGSETLEVKREFIGAIFPKLKSQKSPIDIKRFSEWLRLIRTTAYVRRFIHIKFKLMPPISQFLQVNELQEAETCWWKWSQFDTYPEVVLAFQEKNLKKIRMALKHSNLHKHSVYIDTEGVLRLKGRVQADVPIGNLERNPVILNSKHPYTVLLIRHHHEKGGHHGKDRVVNELKQRYCITGLREAVKRSWRSCQLCKINHAHPEIPEMAPLPVARLQSYYRPFTHTGLDYFGPMEVTIGRRHEKRYGALFTCLVTRAVHMELAGSLSTDSLILALRRFISRRGEPSEIHSDNGTNMVGADNELRKAIMAFDQEKLTSILSAKNVKWIFVPPYAPHMGGSWERMVRSIKTALAATLKERAPKEETLLTLLIEAENTVNGHPLTYVDSDVEATEVLTPNHFLIGTPNNKQPPGEFTDRDLIPGKQWRLAMRLTDHFWNRWVREFLPTLTGRQKWTTRKEPIKVDDMVIIVDNALPRNLWPKGIVIEAPLSQDGQTRWARVKTIWGTYKRPTSKLCVLDIKPSQEKESSGIGNICTTTAVLVRGEVYRRLNAYQKDEGNI